MRKYQKPILMVAKINFEEHIQAYPDKDIHTCISHWHFNDSEDHEVVDGICKTFQEVVSQF